MCTFSLLECCGHTVNLLDKIKRNCRAIRRKKNTCTQFFYAQKNSKIKIKFNSFQRSLSLAEKFIVSERVCTVHIFICITNKFIYAAFRSLGPSFRLMIIHSSSMPLSLSHFPFVSIYLFD